MNPHVMLFRHRAPNRPHHRLEVRKEGYEPFTSDVEVRRNDSVPINVSLPRTR